MEEGGALPAGPDIYRGREAAAGRQSVMLIGSPCSRAVAGWSYAAKTTHFSENIKFFKKRSEKFVDFQKPPYLCNRTLVEAPYPMLLTYVKVPSLAHLSRAVRNHGR